MSKAAGLDVGTMFIVAAAPSSDSTAITKKRNSFVIIPGTPFNRKIYAQKGTVDCMPWGEDIALVGNSALDYANSSMTPIELRRPMSMGILNREERDSLKVMTAIIESVVGNGAGGVCTVTVPAAPVDKSFIVDHHRRVLEGILSKLGWKTEFIGEGMALITASLEESMYTGLGISGGAGMFNVCLSSMASPQFEFSMQQAGDWIDMTASEFTGLTRAEITQVKESGFSLEADNTGQSPHWEMESAYLSLMDSIVENVCVAFENRKKRARFNQPIPVVIGGGTTIVDGFVTRFEEKLKRSRFPVPIGQVFQAEDPLNAVARGALAASMASIEEVDIPENEAQKPQEEVSQDSSKDTSSGPKKVIKPPQNPAGP